MTTMVEVVQANTSR